MTELVDLRTRAKRAFRLSSQQPSDKRKILHVGEFIDDMPSGIPDEAPEGVPAAILRRKVGIPGIKASDLRWRTWFLLNEANSCYLNSEYFACSTVLQSALESWLLEQLESLKIKPGEPFVQLTEIAKEKKIITEEEAELFHELRKLRNTFVHSQEKPWMTPVDLKELDGPPTPETKEFLKTKNSKDLLALVTASELTWKFLTEVISMMRRRYPSDGVSAYPVAQMLRHADFDPKKAH
jgi:hypothetical protein